MSSKERVKDVDNIVDNFIVDKKHIPDIQFCLNKIQEIFGVKVEYDNVVKISGESEKQWLKITGGKWDKQSAKEYIIGLCSPEETLEYNCRRPIQNEEVRDIEKNTNAVIRNLTDKHLIISGTQLAVTLALSAIEELMSNSFESRNESSDTNNHSAVSRDSVASERLACTLQKALSEIGDGNSKSEDYKKVPDSVKRVILDCLSHEDISESDLFESNSKDKSTSATQKHHCSSGDASTTKTAYASSMLGGLDTDGGINFHKADSAVKKQCIDEPMSDFDYFRTFGISVGYSKEEVEEGLQYLNNSVKPTDFLNILKNIKEEKDKTVKCSSAWVVPECSVENTEADAIIIPDTSMMESDDDDVVFLGAKVKTPIRPIKAKNKGGGLSAIEKQEINLQQNEFKELYKKQQASGSRTKGRKDKKMSPDQGGSNSQSERSKSPLGMKRKQADSSDDDQTCVMKVWPAGDSNETTQSCVLLSQDNPIPNLMELSTLSSRETTDNRQPRYIVVDGSNVAMEHGNGKVFSCRGIEICINYFLQRGHKVTAFVPQWRKYKPNYTNPIMDQGVLDILHTNGNLVFTPSRRIQGKTIASYDDRYVLSLAEKEDGIIVSNDQYRDLMLEKQSWCKIIEERLLMFNFVNDHFMPPEDPLGRNGPRLDEFLTKPVAARLLQTQAGYPTHQTALLPTPNVPRYQQLGAWANQGMQKPWQKDCPKTYHQDKQRRDNLQVVTNGKNVRQRNVPNRNLKVTEQLYEKLKTLFPKKDQEEIIRKVLDNHSNETDLNRLTNYCISALFN